MLGKREIMNKELIDIAIERLSYQLIEKHNKFESSILIGLQPRGAFLCKRVLKKLNFYCQLLISNQEILIFHFIEMI
jgi:pyrimidine operon attenuation protein/uracil phosphoribosyltransferase